MKPQEIIDEDKYRPRALFSPTDKYASDIANLLLAQGQPWLKSSNNGQDFRTIYTGKILSAPAAFAPSALSMDSMDPIFMFLDAPDLTLLDQLLRAKNSQLTHDTAYITSPKKWHGNKPVFIPLGDFTYSSFSVYLYESRTFARNFKRLILGLLSEPKVLADIGLSKLASKGPEDIYKYSLSEWPMRRWLKKTSSQKLLSKYSNLIPMQVNQPSSKPILGNNTQALIHADKALLVNKNFYINYVLPKLAKKAKKAK